MKITEKEGWLWDERSNRNEMWCDVIGYEGGYQVSSLGRVRSLDRVNVNRNGVRRVLRGKMLKLSCDSEGYCQVGLFRDGTEVKCRVHRLVALAFLPNPNSLPIVDHRNRNRKINATNNLRWVTHSDNRKNCTALEDMRNLAEAEAS